MMMLFHHVSATPSLVLAVLVLLLPKDHNNVVNSFVVVPTSTTKAACAAAGSRGRPQQQLLLQSPPVTTSSSIHKKKKNTRLLVSTPPVGSSSSIQSSEEDFDDDDNADTGEFELNEEDAMLDMDELIEFDDDETDGVGSMSMEDAIVKRDEIISKLERLAEISSQKGSNAVQQGEDLFNELYELYITTENSVFWPNVDVYNLLLEIHAYSNHPNGGEEATRILRRMEDPNNEANVARPNVRTYLNVIDSWAMRRNPQGAEDIINELTAKCNKAGMNEDELLSTTGVVKPTVDMYNKLMKAYGMAGDIEGVEKLFNKLLKEEEIDSDLKANYKTFVQAMKAYANCDNAPERVQELIDEMKLLYEKTGNEEYKPKTEVYNTLIRALGNGNDATLLLGEDLLYEMIQEYQQNNNEDMRPNANTFRVAMQNYKTTGNFQKRGNKRRIGKSGDGAKMEQLLQLQDALYRKSRQEDLKPDLRLINTALSVIARCEDPKKATRARRIVEKYMILNKQQQEGGNNDASSSSSSSASAKASSSGKIIPSKSTYLNLLNGCASTSKVTSVSPEDKLAAFQIAVQTFNELRSSSSTSGGSRSGDDDDEDVVVEDFPSLTSSHIAMFLRSCASLLPPSKKRDAVVEKVFMQCCKEGLLNQFVTIELQGAASQELQLKMFGGFLEDGVKLPDEWSRNIVENHRMPKASLR